jgi:hypothetical protein
LEGGVLPRFCVRRGNNGVTGEDFVCRGNIEDSGLWALLRVNE